MLKGIMKHDVTNPRNDLSHEFIRERFGFDAVNGRLTRKNRHVGWLHSTGYRYVTVAGKHYKEHRLIWFWVKGFWPTGQIDHRNGKRDDNHLDNLRDVTGTTNQYNKGKCRNNSTGFKGVTYHQGNKRFMAQIRRSGLVKFLGYFDTAEQASRAYNIAIEAIKSE